MKGGITLCIRGIKCVGGIKCEGRYNFVYKGYKV